MNSSELLYFLNTAEPEALTSLPGVGLAMAGRICAARPFVSLEDCCRVRGITLSFIHRLEAAMPDDSKQEEASLAVSTAETENEFTTPEYTPAETPPLREPPSKPSPGSRLVQILKQLIIFLLRLVITLLVLTGIAIGIAYLVPLAYERYIRPVERNAAQVAALETQQVQSAAQIARLQTRLATAEAGQAKQGETITDLTDRVQTVEAGIAEHTKKLAALEEMQNTLLTTKDASLTNMDSQIKLLKALEMLSRARLFLYQSNFGLAKQDVQSARDILAGLQKDAPEAMSADLTEALFRLDLVQKNLPDFPVPASNDLDLAWQVLVQGIPQQTPIPTESITFTPAPTESATPTPTPDTAATPALTSTP
jgi:hypothetical protein